VRSLCTRVVCCAALLTAIYACSEKVSVVQHPILKRTSGTRILEASAGSSRQVPELAQLADRLRRARPVIRIGTLAGPPGTILGRPVDADETSSGDVLILDAMSGEVRQFSPQGTFIRTLLPKGRGPVEISNPISIDVVRSRSGEDLVYIASRVAVKAFTISGRDVTLTRNLQPPDIPLPSDACIASGVIHVRGGLRTDSGVVAAVRGGDRASRRFAKGYDQGGSLAREELSAGPLACLPDGGVVVAFTYLPRVSAYDSLGNERWTAEVPEFEGLLFEESLQGKRSMSFASRMSKGGHLVQVVKLVPPGGVLLQVLQLDEAKPGAPRVQRVIRTRTFLTSASDGTGFLLSDSLPSIIGVTARHLWTVEEGPAGHPVVVGYRY
jgi:hypothetical protein